MSYSTAQLSRFRRLAKEVERLRQTPLAAVAEILDATIGSLAGDTTKLEIHGSLSSVADYIDSLISALPSTFGDRFYFDTVMIQTLAEEWNPQLNLRRFLLPSYDSAWGYRLLMLPSENRLTAKVIHQFLIKGKEYLPEVDLLDYAWIAHELGHYLLYLFPNELPTLFKPKLEEFVRNLRLRAVADRGSARTKSMHDLSQLQQFWTPGINQQNWAHELAFDTLALWTCGPAFVHAFCTTMDVRNPDPFVLKQSHPPYIIRANALLFACHKLGITDVSELLRLRNAQVSLIRERSETNSLLLFSPEDLVHGAVEDALTVAKKLSLRKFRINLPSPEKYKQDPYFGADVMTIALNRWRSSPSTYNAWQDEILSSLSGSVTR